MKLKNITKYLPVGSGDHFEREGMRRNTERLRAKGKDYRAIKRSNSIKSALHNLYAWAATGTAFLLSLVYLTDVTSTGSLSIPEQSRIKQERRVERERYNTAIEKVLYYADRDSTEGLSPGELQDLLNRAGVSGNVNLRKRVIRIEPKLDTKRLERAVKSYEDEGLDFLPKYMW